MTQKFWLLLLRVLHWTSWLFFFESHIEELPDLCVEKLAEAFDKRASNTSCHREFENWKDLAAWARIELKRRKKQWTDL